MSVHLYQKRCQLEPILNNIFHDDENKTIYDCHTPNSMKHRTTTISKSLGHTSDTDNSDNFEYIAQIDWRVIHSSKIRFANGRFSGQEMKASDYLKKKSWTGRQHVFTAEDGKEYIWRDSTLHIRVILFLTDKVETPVAVYRRETLRKGAHLEILPLGKDLMDEIVVTVVYIEQQNMAQIS
ncbi:hypothetical protein DFH05DRAFT_1393424 [Lentinula detonsa]|uniref:DUF6593 domain-containing protein n=1 Tax=Lentinula detonsa TaxID=2804962 RepID=A0A9W8P6V3_9AGAR|nr:hypothetical protein DFH05DRAFT_1393424 [Lentinula detonsa]